MADESRAKSTPEEILKITDGYIDLDRCMIQESLAKTARAAAYNAKLKIVAGELLDKAGDEIVLVRGGKALVPYDEGDGRRGYDIYEALELDGVGHDQYERTVLEATARAIGSPASLARDLGDDATIAGAIRLATDCTELECLMAVERLKTLPATSIPKEMFDFAVLAGELIKDLRQSKRPLEFEQPIEAWEDEGPSTLIFDFLDFVEPNEGESK